MDPLTIPGEMAAGGGLGAIVAGALVIVWRNVVESARRVGLLVEQAQQFLEANSTWQKEHAAHLAEEREHRRRVREFMERAERALAAGVPVQVPYDVTPIEEQLEVNDADHRIQPRRTTPRRPR
jgi:hypothetical protein